jgi:hypothetical protein
VISVGVLYDAQKLLATVQTSKVTAAELLVSFSRMEVAEFGSVLSLAQQCQWIEVDQENVLGLGTSGRKINAEANPAIQLRYQLKDVLALMSPSWAKKIADGRKEALSKMPDDVRQIFEEAGLLSDWLSEPDLIEWWDSIGLAARNRRGEANLRTGRTAERMTIEYEEERTGQRPAWVCAETNYAGFDVLSIVDKDEARLCPIEVKGTTMRPKEAFFTLSRNEWSTAESNPDYRLHLWLVREGKAKPAEQLRVVHSNALKAHVPVDQSEGKWETVRISFATFW